MSKSIPNPINDLREIRSLMERSRYFIGLSGLSGIGAGVSALLGVTMVIAYQWAGDQDLIFISRTLRLTADHPWGIAPIPFLSLTALGVLLGAIGSGYFFTVRRARRLGQSINDRKTYQLIFHLSVPLMVGALFSVALIYHEHGGFIGPATLIFYGLALLNGSGYAREELSYLGYLEICLGLLSCFFMGYGLHFWALGFGVLHIIYGIWMYYKYDRS
jgi:hypothetical protein